MQAPFPFGASGVERSFRRQQESRLFLDGPAASPAGTNAPEGMK